VCAAFYAILYCVCPAIKGIGVLQKNANLQSERAGMSLRDSGAQRVGLRVKSLVVLESADARTQPFV
jgi:hypothetical protein